MSITRYALFADEHEGHFTGFGQHERGDYMLHSEHVAELDVMHTRALKAEKERDFLRCQVRTLQYELEHERAMSTGAVEATVNAMRIRAGQAMSNAMTAKMAGDTSIALDSQSQTWVEASKLLAHFFPA